MEYHRGLQIRRHSDLSYCTQQEDDNFSSTYSTHVKSAQRTRQAHSSSAGLPQLKRRYIPSLYHNQDKMLTRKVKEFLQKPPLNSQEYFDMLWLRGQSQPSRDNEDDSRPKSAPSSPDELSKKFWYLLPEKRTIQSMILPPIRDGCVTNYHDKHVSKRTDQFVDPSVDLMEQLKYCRYLRPRPTRHKAWEEKAQDL